jgi:hypothetical protein
MTARSAVQPGLYAFRKTWTASAMIQPVEILEITVLVDTGTDSLSTNPGFVETEMAGARRRGMKWLSGRGGRWPWLAVEIVEPVEEGKPLLCVRHNRIAAGSNETRARTAPHTYSISRSKLVHSLHAWSTGYIEQGQAFEWNGRYFGSIRRSLHRLAKECFERVED